jgi:cytochrome b involved in lipid metabolism
MSPAGSVTAVRADTLRLPQFSRSQVALHNDAAHGYWFGIEQRVYDVTDFMGSHPGGDRILQLYAGRDATLGFQRVHQERRQVTALLERCQIGVLRSLACSAQPEHAAHHAAVRCLDATLQLVVEMQNALRVDQSFRLEPLTGALAQSQASRRSRYELQRGLETHARFHREYLDVLSGDHLPRLASSIEPAAEFAAEFCGRLETLQRSPDSVVARATALELFAELERFSDQELAASLASFEVLDSGLLYAWKRELSRSLRVLERAHSPALQLSDTRLVYSVCDRLLSHLVEYFRPSPHQTEP